MPYPVLKGEIASKKASIVLKVRYDDKRTAVQDIDVAFGSSDIKGTAERAQRRWQIRVDIELALDGAQTRRPAASFRRRTCGEADGERRQVDP
jgi:hypothetical protein